MSLWLDHWPYGGALSFGLLKGLGWAHGEAGAAGASLRAEVALAPVPEGTAAPSFTPQLWLEPAAGLRPRGVPLCWKMGRTPSVAPSPALHPPPPLQRCLAWCLGPAGLCEHRGGLS